MTAVEMQKIVVFRRPIDQGNYRYWLAEVSEEDARRLEERLTSPDGSWASNDESLHLGDALTLPQVMEKLTTRDFQVVDFPSAN